MVSLEAVQKLMLCFPQSFINYNIEFIAHRETNTYFQLKDCQNEFDIKCKVLAWLSRSAFKTQPYHGNSKNKKFHEFILNGINKYLGTNFSEDNMRVIYTYLGNMCNRLLTEKFINSGYNMGILKEREGK